MAFQSLQSYKSQRIHCNENKNILSCEKKPRISEMTKKECARKGKVRMGRMKAGERRTTTREREKREGAEAFVGA